MERHMFVFDTTVVIQEIKINEGNDADFSYQHRLIVGTIASEWAKFPFLSHITLGGRTFVSCIDGRAIFPRCFEVVAGLERLL